MNKKWLRWLSAAILPVAMAVPQSASAATSCVGSECVVEFAFTGGPQSFSPPAGAKNFRFEVLAGSGGRGAAGGKVTGTLTQVPETIYVYVGGAGRMGSGVQGGYNGGGGSGGNSGTEGSGGGASDLRLDGNLNTRVVVAGGGGGGGGEAGGNGGVGGDTYGGNGVSGQGSGGLGGAPDRGGNAGASNGGFSQATAGTFGIGGRGGYSGFAGGGGGGGGWYGGGGGGSDDNTCCSDGGGGGGGSSYASNEYTSNVSYQAGSNWGDGKITIRFTQPPSVTSFELSQQTGALAIFSMAATENLVGLTTEDFGLTGSGCQLSSLLVEGTVASGEITGCDTGPVSLTLRKNTFGQSELGPAEDQVAVIDFDADPPSFAFSQAAFTSNASEHAINFEVSDSLNLDAEMFSVQGCEYLSVLANALSLSGCAEGTVTATLKALSLSDAWQNLGPLQDAVFSFEIDQTAPSASWSEISFTGVDPFEYVATLSFTEPVVVSEGSLSFESSVECESSFQIGESSIDVQASCSHAELSWTFTPAVVDLVGNAMELSPLTVSISNLLPEPEPETEPEPEEEVQEPTNENPVVGGGGTGGAADSPAQDTPQDSSPAPSPTPEVEAAPELTTPDPAVEITPEPQPSESETPVPEPDPEPVALPLPSPSSQGFESMLETMAPAPEPVQLTEPEVAEVEPEPVAEPEPAVDTFVAQPVSGGELTPEDQGLPWLPMALLLTVLALGFGVWRFSER